MKNGIEEIIKQFDRYGYYIHDKISRGIDENRKGCFTLIFKDKDGNLLKNAHVKIRQTRHEFRFGCAAFYLDQYEDIDSNRQFRKKFCELFNYAIVPLYWDALEPHKGELRFDKNSSPIKRRPPVDTIMEFCEENHIRAKGHCLVYNSFQPNWISDDNEIIKRQITKRIREISQRYEDRIFDFDVINEMLTIYKNAYQGNGMRNLQITDEKEHEKWAFDICRNYLPNANLYWNEGMYETFGSEYKGFRSFYYQIIDRMLKSGVKIDGLGMQYHAYAPKEAAYHDLKQVCNPLRILDVLECYGDFRLPIHLSEVSIPSFTNESEDEALQAELTRRLYRLWFSSKYTEAIVWWNLCDNTAYGSENTFHAGLLRYDCTEKPAYRELRRLIHEEWMTKLDENIDGELRFCGFYGDYDVEVEYNGQKRIKHVRLHKDNTGYDNRLCDFREKEIIL